MPQQFATPSASTLVVSRDYVLPITDALSELNDLRLVQLAHPNILQAVQTIKRAQVQRFRRSYADVLDHSDWAPPAHFFLQELYGDGDYSQRDSEFSRIAPALQRLFPKPVVRVAATLVNLHVLSEKLDDAMANAMLLMSPSPPCVSEALKNYVSIWRSVGQPAARAQQLELVQNLGMTLAKLTRSSSLRVMLRMMRGPAHSAGLQHLQDFLERGFDVFAALQRSKSGSAGFLNLVNERENAWVDRLFHSTDANSNGITLWAELE